MTHRDRTVVLALFCLGLICLTALLRAQDRMEEKLGRRVEQANHAASAAIAAAQGRANKAGSDLDSYCKTVDKRAGLRRDYVWGCVQAQPLPPPSTTTPGVAR